VTTVFVVDDHPIVAQGIALVLDGDAELRFAGAAGGLREATADVARVRPDVVLLDVRLPGTDVVTAVEALTRAAPAARILLFTADPSHPHVRNARAAGAVATLAKDTPPARLRRLIRAAAQGGPLEDDTDDASVLTARQHDVLTRVATGMTNVEIAEELGLQPTTVKAYWQETMQRLGVRNRAEAIAAAYRRGLL
jgi:DNA-binding NarL/FixJ family response regulator